ncbi:hypothetical protein PG993_013438 [Apiospora rasikravindrae]|uniref:Uncharacterized protein n=1 Tax=Apiospora rasikravindrae TaxID=990691 RepID=A0ABR1RZ74_9PEZI
MAQQAFAQQVSFMEGYHRIFPAKDTLPVTLDNINNRLITLERVHGRPQAPTIAPDWETLRYRTLRLWRDSASGGGTNNSLVIACDQWWPENAGMSDSAIQQSMAVALERTLRSLGINSYSAATLEEAAKGEDDTTDVDGANPSSSNTSNNQFDIAAQELCHLAGKNRKKPIRPFQNVRELYGGAIEMSMVLEGLPAVNAVLAPPPALRPPAPPMPPPSHPGMRPIYNAPRRKRKACCGCCSCKCHETRKRGFASFMCGGRSRADDSDSDTGSDTDDERTWPSRKVGWRRLLPNWRWLSNGRKKRRSGYGTDTSSNSSTLAD